MGEVTLNNNAATITNGVANAQDVGSATLTSITQTASGAAGSIITNWGTISKTGGSATDPAVTLTGDSATFNNHGKVTGVVDMSGANAIFTNSAIVSTTEGVTGNVTDSGSITGDVKMTGASARFTNNEGATITGNVTLGAASDADNAVFTNDTGASITGNVSLLGSGISGTNSGSIGGTFAMGVGSGTNSGTITGATTLTGTGTDARSTFNNSGTAAAITGTYATITNSGTIASATLTNSTLTNNAGGTTTGAISLSVGDANGASNVSTISNSGTLNNISITGGTNGNAGETTTLTATITNSGTAGDLTITTDTTKAGTNKTEVTLQNSGTFGTTNVGGGATFSATNSGTLGAITVSGNDATLTINNSGTFNGIALGATTGNNITLTGTYRASFNTSYATQGALNITGTGGTTTINATGARYIVDMATYTASDTGYDLANFFGGVTGTGNTINNGTTANLASRISTSQAMYGVSVDSAGILRATVNADRTIGALGSLQTFASINSQIFRATNIIDGVFDAVTSGEQGVRNFDPTGLTPTIKVKKAEGKEATNAKDGEEGEIVVEDPQYKGYTAFILPYYSATSLSPTAFGGSFSGNSFGFIAGGTKETQKGVLVGAHFGLDSGTLGASGDQMQILSTSFLIGAHLKVPFTFIQKGNITYSPFMKAHFNYIAASNTSRLTPTGDTTREVSSVVSAYSFDAMLGVDIRAKFGILTPEIGLMHQGMFLPQMSYTGFTDTQNDHVIGAVNIMPVYGVFQIRYVKDIKLKSATLFPTIKAGVRGLFSDSNYGVTASILNGAVAGTYYAQNQIDSVVGLVEIGIGARMIKNLNVNLSYSGEFGKQVMTNSVFLKVGWQF